VYLAKVVTCERWQIMNLSGPLFTPRGGPTNKIASTTCLTEARWRTRNARARATTRVVRNKNAALTRGEFEHIGVASTFEISLCGHVRLLGLTGQRHINVVSALVDAQAFGRSAGP
jgi:hypothetical protein